LPLSFCESASFQVAVFNRHSQLTLALNHQAADKQRLKHARPGPQLVLDRLANLGRELPRRSFE
jgi:hypothetical protein